jgi:hypothetical protein
MGHRKMAIVLTFSRVVVVQDGFEVRSETVKKGEHSHARMSARGSLG